MARFNKDVFDGAEFGSWVVLRRIPNSGGRVECLCECGFQMAVLAASLVNGRSKSCGRCKRLDPTKGYGKIQPGVTFGRLTIICRVRKNNRYTGQVECQCSCGTKRMIGIDALVCGGTKSCGCLASDVTTQRNKATAKYGGFSAKNPRTFASWRSMLDRCYNPKQQSYKDYGAKGVVVCQGLREHPKNLTDLIGFRKSKKPSLDRNPIHDGNYTCGKCKECRKKKWPLNVRWATRKEQSLNRGDFNVYLTAFGKTMTRSQWGELSGIHEWRIHRRIHELGWTVEKSLTTPDRKGNCYKVKDLL